MVGAGVRFAKHPLTTQNTTQPKGTLTAANSAAVSARGGNAAFIAAGQKKFNRLQQLNNEQEKLKADLKRKTAEVDAAKKDLSL